MEDRREAFNQWMRGSTVGICDGITGKHIYDANQQYVGYQMAWSFCGPHGAATYPVDVWRFLEGLPQDD